jgi:DNA-binding MurR/RpiR family transcriptional regulator
MPQDVAAVTPTGRLEAVRERLSSMLATMSPTQRRIAEYVLGNAERVIHMSITELAEQTDASEGSVVALCQQVGARGFQQLKIALAGDIVQPVQFIHEDLGRNDPPKTVVAKVFASGLQAMNDTLKILDIGALETAARAIRASRRTEVYGIGSSAPIAEDAAYRLLRIGIDARAVVDSHVQAISASLTGPDVVVLTISHSGATHETVSATRLARESGAITICVTNYGRSPILAHAAIVLHTMAKETRFRTEAMTSRIAQLAVIDSLVASVALLDHDRSVKTLRKTFDVLSGKRF